MKTRISFQYNWEFSAVPATDYTHNRCLGTPTRPAPHTASLYILSRRLRRPIPSWPYRLHGAPAPSVSPPRPHPPTQACLVICASAERAKRNVLHVGVERMGAKTSPVERVWVTATHQWRAVGTQVDSRHRLSLGHAQERRAPKVLSGYPRSLHRSKSSCTSSSTSSSCTASCTSSTSSHCPRSS